MAWLEIPAVLWQGGCQHSLYRLEKKPLLTLVEQFLTYHVL